MPKPEEEAILIVRGRNFKDWLSVWVQHRAAEAWPHFRFTSAERAPYPNVWEKVQHVPGDTVTIMLAGIVALEFGYIITRQVAYDGKNHQIMLQGMGRTWQPATSSIEHPTNNFDGKNLKQVADEVWAPWDVGPEVIGQLDLTPFESLRPQPGETTWNFLERIARVRGAVLGSTYYGTFVIIGKHLGHVTDTLIEGVNILKCQVVHTKKDIFSKYINIGQTKPSDKKYGEAANQMKCNAWSKFPPPPPGRVLITPAEQPVKDKEELCTRAEYERQWHDGSVVTATVTVHGWLRPGRRDIWRVRDNVHIYSPMALLQTGEGRPVTMKIQNATFTQDDKSGTLTTLDLVMPELLNDQTPVDIGMPPQRQQPPGGDDGPMRAPPPFGRDDPADMAVPREPIELPPIDVEPEA